MKGNIAYLQRRLNKQSPIHALPAAIYEWDSGPSLEYLSMVPQFRNPTKKYNRSTSNRTKTEEGTQLVFTQ